jgi:hypothetical protein
MYYYITDNIKAPLGAPNRGPILGLSGAPSSAPILLPERPLERPLSAHSGLPAGVVPKCKYFFSTELFDRKRPKCQKFSRDSECAVGPH